MIQDQRRVERIKAWEIKVVVAIEVTESLLVLIIGRPLLSEQ